MSFAELERRYAELNGQRQAGLLSEEAYHASVADLRVTDAWGREWAIAAHSGRWHVHQGGEWVPADPHGTPPPSEKSCPQCGSFLPNGAAFCDKCGSLVESPSPPPGPPPAPPAQGGKNRGLVIAGIAAIGVGLLACLGLLVYGVMTPSSPLRQVLPGFSTETPARQVACAPPACGSGEAYYCPGECPGGCGIVCATFTPAPGGQEAGAGGEVSLTASETPNPVCTPPACGPDEVLHCPDECPGGCGVVCVTVTPRPSPSDTPLSPGATPSVGASPTEGMSPSPAPSDTPSATPTSRPPGFITGFETFGTWTRGDQPHGSLVQQSSRVHSGSYAGGLSYDLPVGSNDFVVFMRDIPLAGQPNVVRVWVDEDGSNNFLNVWVKDAEGERWQATFGQLTGSGWRQREAIIDPGQPWPWAHIDGPSNGEVDYPIRFHALVLDGVEGGSRVGTIAVDDLSYATLSVLPPAPSPDSSAGSSPTPCSREAWGWFEGALTFSPGMREKIGCPTEEVQSIVAATQDYEHGVMAWRKDEGRIYVFYEGTAWESYVDAWDASMPEQDPAFGPAPDGYLQPKRGFGLVWQEHPSVRDRLGWGVNEERACDDAHAQPFERGHMMSCTHDVVPGAKTYVFTLYDDSTYDIYLP